MTTRDLPATHAGLESRQKAHSERADLPWLTCLETGRDPPEGRGAGARSHTCCWVRRRCDLYTPAITEYAQAFAEPEPEPEAVAVFRMHDQRGERELRSL